MDCQVGNEIVKRSVEVMYIRHGKMFVQNGVLIDPDFTERMASICSGYAQIAGDPWEAGRLMVEALEARLETLKSVSK